jgi:hypothetical protein
VLKLGTKEEQFLELLLSYSCLLGFFLHPEEKGAKRPYLP